MGYEERPFRPPQANGWEYCLFDRAGYISDNLAAGRPVVITWVPNTVRLHCRDYQDIFGIPDIMGIEEVPSLLGGGLPYPLSNHRL